MTPVALRNLIVITSVLTFTCDANAFWWLARAAAGRSAVGAAARTGVGAIGALEAESALTAGARFCVRPVGAGACDFRMSSSAIDAASRAVGPGYRIRPTPKPTIFEVIDAAGTVVNIIQAIGTDADSAIAALPQYQPQLNPPTGYEGQSTQPMVAPLRHNGDVLNIHVNGVPTYVWSDGYVEVWADNHPNRVVIPPGHRIHFPNHGTVHAIPKSPEAYTLFSQASGQPQAQQPQQSAPQGVFPWGSNVSCPQIAIGNGMARCQ